MSDSCPKEFIFRLSLYTAVPVPGLACCTVMTVPGLACCTVITCFRQNLPVTTTAQPGDMNCACKLMKLVKCM